MNRPGAAPQTQAMRGIPGGYNGQQQPQQQQPQQPGRSASNRPSNGKIAANNSGWAFGGGVPMGGAGLQNPSRQMGGNVSFAQSLSGSQSTAPLDLSEFPSLSNNAQLPSASQGSMWSTTGSRTNLSGPVQRSQGTPVQSQPGQEDLFNPAASRMASAQVAFRFGSQSNPTSTSQAQSNSADEFPPLNRNGNGDLAPGSLGFGSANGASAGPSQTTRGNGLLNALSANSRSSDVRSPPGGLTRSQHAFREDSTEKSQASSAARTKEGEDAAAKPKEDKENHAPEAVDPLEGMPHADKWGVKGLRTLMNNYPDYHTMVVGIDPVTLGVDMSSPELISNQHYSLFDDAPPRPTVSGSRFRLPDCYNVTNVQPIETKITSFNEETLFWIFYSCPHDVKQHLAASELHSRNWRWHKKHQVWLTKDEHMTPQILSPTHERGYYIVWDTSTWRKDRREFTLYYNDLDTSLSQPPVLS